MAEIEYKGIKVGGSKMLLILPLIGTIIGGLWGGFELYNRYLMMEQKIDAYVAPDMSEFDKNLAILKEDYILMKEEIGIFKEMLGDVKSDVHDIKIEIKDDVGDLHDSMDKQARTLTDPPYRRESRKLDFKFVKALESMIPQALYY